MSRYAALRIRLRHQEGHAYRVTMGFTVPGSEAETDLLHRKTPLATFNIGQLNILSGDPEAYGERLTASECFGGGRYVFGKVLIASWHSGLKKKVGRPRPACRKIGLLRLTGGVLSTPSRSVQPNFLAESEARRWRARLRPAALRRA